MKVSRHDACAGRLILLTGDGRGKTTSALGLLLRALGHDLRASLVQFMKAGLNTGELKALRRMPGLEIQVCGRGFVPPTTSPDFDAHRQAAVAGLQGARERLADPALGMVVLDEICGAIAHGLLDEADVLAALDQAHAALIVVLTGRGASPGLIARADTVSRIESVKHALEQGRPAQPGVEC